MIYVDRARVPMPNILGPKGRGEDERQKAKAFYLYQRDRQQRFEFNTFRSSDLRDALRELFQNKCAYCETVLMFSEGHIELYRPKSAVSECASHPGYWWLALEWSNMLLACPECNRVRSNSDKLTGNTSSGKGNRFPLVDESTRAFGPQDNLEKEEPLLLDPCNDDPNEHLIFDWDGSVASETLRGKTTIAVLGLNSKKLLAERASRATHLRELLQNLKYISNQNRENEWRNEVTNIKTLLAGYIDSRAPYAGMMRQLINLSRSELLASGTAILPILQDQNKGSLNKARIARAQKSLRDFEKIQSSYSLSDEKGRHLARSQQRTIEHIKLDQFKGVRHVEIDLTAKENHGGWLMVLGENSTGKSSLLQAIALCLAGADYFADLVKEGRLSPKELVNSRARKAVVTLKLTGFNKVHQLSITPRGAMFTRPSGKTSEVVVSDSGQVTVSGDDEARKGQIVLLGYGATRLLPRHELQPYGQDFARIDNLFDSFVPLLDADRYLVELSRKDFDRTALALKDLLSLESDARLHRKHSQVYVNRHGDNSSINQLSDGFQSVVALTVDILEVATRLWQNPETAQGIVLLDEIGAHLHPTWKMRIVTSLRRAFPGMQFIATTHDPLCLRGLSKGEVIVMLRNEVGHIVPLTDLPSPSDYRIDQLLTSEFFGLNSTVDPETEEIFDRYYALLALKEKTQQQTKELELLQLELRDRRFVGDTLRDQLMFEAVDIVIAKHRAEGNISIPEMKKHAAEELACLWRKAMSGKEGSQS